MAVPLPEVGRVRAQYGIWQLRKKGPHSTRAGCPTNWNEGWQRADADLYSRFSIPQNENRHPQKVSGRGTSIKAPPEYQTKSQCVNKNRTKIFSNASSARTSELNDSRFCVCRRVAVL